MLYLFNSAYRPLYTGNVLNTLFLPAGYTNEYRYRCTGDPRYVPPDVYAKIEKLSPGYECVVCFVDRFAPGGYVYHPLRRATFVSRREDAGSLYVKIQLGQFIYARNLDIFKGHLVHALGAGVPSLTGGDPKNSHDGAYTLFGEDVFNPKTDYFTDDEAWTTACDALSQTYAFSTNAEQVPLFLRVDVRQSSGRRVAPVLRDGVSRYELAKGKRYDIVATYRFPKQRSEHNARTELQLHFGDNVRSLGPSLINIDSHTNSVPSTFASKRYIEDTAGAITLSTTDDGASKLLFAKAPLQYEVKESAAFWAQTALALGVFSIAAALVGIDFAAVSPFSFRCLIETAWPKLVFGALQSVALFWLLRLVGKKVV